MILTRSSKRIAKKGYIAVRENGTTVKNHAHAPLNLTFDLLSLCRSLGVNARAREAAHVASKKTQIAKAIEADNPLNDGLITRPQ